MHAMHYFYMVDIYIGLGKWQLCQPVLFCLLCAWFLHLAGDALEQNSICRDIWRWIGTAIDNVAWMVQSSWSQATHKNDSVLFLS